MSRRFPFLTIDREVSRKETSDEVVLERLTLRFRGLAGRTPHDLPDDIIERIERGDRQPGERIVIRQVEVHIFESRWRPVALWPYEATVAADVVPVDDPELEEDAKPAAFGAQVILTIPYDPSKPEGSPAAVIDIGYDPEALPREAFEAAVEGFQAKALALAAGTEDPTPKDPVLNFGIRRAPVPVAEFPNMPLPPEWLLTATLRSGVEVVQGPGEQPVAFLTRLTYAMGGRS